MEATVIAALVTSAASLLAAGAGGLYFNTRLAINAQDSRLLCLSCAGFNQLLHRCNHHEL